MFHVLRKIYETKDCIRRRLEKWYTEEDHDQYKDGFQGQLAALLRELKCSVK